MAEISSPRPSSSLDRPSSLHTRSINLQDHTKPSEDAAEIETPTSPTEFTEAHRSTFDTLRQQRSRLKYHRYGVDRVETEDTEGKDLTAHSSWGQGHIQRGYRHIHDALNPRGTPHDTSSDRGSEIDVLYENERGFFMCGTSHFSQNLLGPLDRAAWTDAEFKKSRVNITNAQVPDPSWEWFWKTWYVDMGRDVDEEGWEYSLGSRWSSWHGNHPWFSSFVRRRKWIRKRVRKRVMVTDKTFGDAHQFPDYFTIHTGRVKSLTSGLTSSPRPEEAEQRGFARGWDAGAEEGWETPKIEDIGTLLTNLREAPVDSERVAAIKSFLDNGSDDLYYLAGEVCYPLVHYNESNFNSRFRK
jgi:hypothetical protein